MAIGAKNKQIKALGYLNVCVYILLSNDPFLLFALAFLAILFLACCQIFESGLSILPVAFAVVFIVAFLVASLVTYPILAFLSATLLFEFVIDSFLCFCYELPIFGRVLGMDLCLYCKSIFVLVIEAVFSLLQMLISDLFIGFACMTFHFFYRNHNFLLQQSF